jgi:ABC-2 type transport system ATP-binding protein
MVIDFQNVTYAIPNGQMIYRNLNLRVYEKEYYGILGKNGAGKSTLIEMIMGMRKLTEGKIKVFGEDANASNRKNKNKVFVVSHDILIPGNIKVSEMFKFYHHFYPDYDRNMEKELLNLFEINPTKKFGALSTGQKIKALLCAAFAARAELYLFDEVTAVLDPKSRRNFFKFLNEFKHLHNCSVFLATNIAEDLENCMDKVIFIDNDQKVIVKDVSNIDSLFEDDDVKSEAS